MADKEQYAKERNVSSKETFLTFLCNKRTGEFCGRTPASWAKIILFYIIFYACLAAFWAVMLLIFYQTIDYNEPKWQLSESRIGVNPGLGFRPRAPAKKVESTLIWFSSNRPETYNESVQDIKNFISENNSTESQNVASNEECLRDVPMENKDKFCLFDVKTTEMYNLCTEDDAYGYKSSKPCILVKLNRIFGWKPVDYEDGKVPDKIKDSYQKGHILITCEGENPADAENIGNVTYYPKSGISFKYFPFRNKPGYVSPFVWVQFSGTTPGLLINVECKAWAGNIKHDRMDREGSVHFELLID
ncbi:sodium/potassium-transporting ATPase subunit beta-like protein [Leptotrombidium deliense]|uniref:Sodium/potassium-transporting ATPase subunit beta-like protein n=1 Tax=Leptotrombidium deliense TaxID=299467 RepID=A0A443S6V2_9ACAR|nr:sodium/potassium-transporting ATPase subunit beta-like protein [Leptotrombidium deliense]